jgi:hypothetical protein
MGDAMNPLSPDKILRNLENGYFMTHQEQAEAAQYIRQLQQENLTLLGKTEIPMTPEYLPQFIATNNIKPIEGGGGAGGKEWVGLTDEEIKEVLDCGRGGLVDIKKAEQILKEKNT